MTTELIERLRERAHDPNITLSGGHRWADIDGNTYSFTTRPPATEEQIAAAETRLGFRLPDPLRRLYLEVGNGGFGPGFGLLSLPDVSAAPSEGDVGPFDELDAVFMYELSRRQHTDPRWPEGLLTICYWGCGIESLVDNTKPEAPVICLDPNWSRETVRDRLPEDRRTELAVTFEEGCWVEAHSLEEWLRSWVDGEKRFSPPFDPLPHWEEASEDDDNREFRDEDEYRSGEEYVFFDEGEDEMTQPWYVKAYDEHYYQVYGDEFTLEQTKAEVDGLVALLNLTPGARVLDLCCGFGRHSLELARRRYEVTGLDFSPALLRHAREAAQSERLDVTWIEADMRDIPIPPVPYDAVVNLFSAFGFFDDDREEARVAEAIARVLAPGGRVLIETVNREIMLRQWMPLRWREKPDGTLLLDRLRFESETGTLHTREIIVHPDGRREEDAHRLRLWAFTELAALLRGAGLVDMRPFGGLDGSRYTPDSRRMIVAARRP